jgi:hypothetical protein
MFSIQTFEAGREPLRLEDVPPAVITWLQHMGGWASFFFVLWLLLGYTRMRSIDKARIPRWESLSILLLGCLAAAGFLLGGVSWAIVAVREGAGPPPTWSFRSLCLAAGGLCAILAVCLPIVRQIATLRWRRIWALTRLSFKESVRSRFLYAFSALLIVFLFATWFISSKPEDQVRSYVGLVYFVMAGLLLLTGLILASFSIPTDVKNQTIHTIVTKPVERFEVLLGRFLGFTLLMLLVLGVMATLSLVYVLRGVDPAAAAESLKARDPLYGKLQFESLSGARDQKATNVGREWDYRSYITGGPGAGMQNIAVWDFASVPGSLAGRKSVRCEFAFDIYRTNKGQENRGIPCAFLFQTAGYRKERDNDYRKERDALRAAGRKEADIDNELANKYGYFEVPIFEVFDYHTQSFEVPGGLFENALEKPTSPPAAGPQPPPLQVRVVCKSKAQFIGMAQYDLYLRADDPEGSSDRLWFAVNFYKGALGLGLLLCLVIGLAVSLSCYLSGVITLLVVACLVVLGVCREFLQSVAFGTNPEGGPFLSFVHLTRREVGIGNLAPDSTAARLASGSDAAFRFVFRLFLDWIPDVRRFALGSYVEEGFNIPWLQLLLNTGLLVGVVLPWIVIGYYLIKWREVASST